MQGIAQWNLELWYVAFGDDTQIHFLFDAEDPLRLTLFEYAGIELATPCRKNELLQHTMPDDYQRIRKRVEVVFSQLVDQFSIRKNYTKSQMGLFTRIISKVTLFTMLQYINLMNNKPLSQMRYTLSA